MVLRPGERPGARAIIRRACLYAVLIVAVASGVAVAIFPGHLVEICAATAIAVALNLASVALMEAFGWFSRGRGAVAFLAYAVKLSLFALALGALAGVGCHLPVLVLSFAAAQALTVGTYCVVVLASDGPGVGD